MTETPVEPLNFEQALTALEHVVQQLEDGQVGLEESLACYEKGIGLIKQCHGQLHNVEQRIAKLTGVDADGKPTLEPFEHTAAAETTKGRRKKDEEG